MSSAQRSAFLEALELRSEEAEDFVSGLSIDYSGSSDAGIAQYDTSTGQLNINAWHPFVATFHDEFASKSSSQPLQLFAMAEILIEAHLHAVGIKADQIEEFLSARDQLLRNLANESGRQSAFSVASDLLNARNNPALLEEKLCGSFRMLGFEVTPIGGSGKPDGVATAHLSADQDGTPRRYAVSLEAKSKVKGGAKVSAKSVGISTVARQRDKFDCDHAIVVGPAFPTTQGEKCALSDEIKDDRRKSAAENKPKTITLITIDDLAKLIRLRPVKQLGLLKLRELFEQCELPEDSAKWVESIRATRTKKPPYRPVLETIEVLQKKFKKQSVKYAAVRVELSHATPAVNYETDEELADLCKAMAQMASGAMSASSETVELDQSAENVIAAIDAAMKEYPINEQ